MLQVISVPTLTLNCLLSMRILSVDVHLFMGMIHIGVVDPVHPVRDPHLYTYDHGLFATSSLKIYSIWS